MTLHTTNTTNPQNRIRCMKTETNELVYQAVDPGLAEKMRNLGCVRMPVHTYIRVCACACEPSRAEGGAD